MKEHQMLVNEAITTRRVVVIDSKGNRIGEFLTQDAIALAEKEGLDLVMVGAQSDPPTCKIMDFGKLLYEQKKRAKGSNSAVVKVKEIRLSPTIDSYDLQVRAKQARRFLEKGHKVKVTLRFKGRQMVHNDIGFEQCEEFLSYLEDIAQVDSEPSMLGKVITMLISRNPAS